MTNHDKMFETVYRSVYQVFDFERYIKELDERIEINSKIVEQIKKYRTTLNKWKEELAGLVALAGTNASIDDRILELDILIKHNHINAFAHSRNCVLKNNSSVLKCAQLIFENLHLRFPCVALLNCGFCRYIVGMNNAKNFTGRLAQEI